MEQYRNKTAIIRELIEQCNTKLQSEAIDVNHRFAQYARIIVCNHNTEVSEHQRLSVQYTGGRLIIKRRTHNFGQLIEDVRFKDAYDIVTAVLCHNKDCTPVQYDKVRSEFQRILNELKPRLKKEAP